MAPEQTPPLDDPGTAGDLDAAVAALRAKCPQPAAKPHNSKTSHRGLLALLLCAEFVGGVFALFAANQEARPSASPDSQANGVYVNAHSGSCLVWPPDAPERPSFVQCAGPHLFEVVKTVDVGSDPEPCELAVRHYLGPHYDPNSRFTPAVLKAGESGGSVGGDRKLLCGLQLLGPDGKPVPFSGQIAGQDQSRTWPPGTCLGIDPQTNSPTSAAVDCSEPHSLEVVGMVNLGERFAGTPSDADQQAELGEQCTQLAKAYLAPKTLSATGWEVTYHAITPTSWAAGSRQASCSLGPETPEAVTGSVKSHATAPGFTEEPTATPTTSTSAPHRTTTETTTAPTVSAPATTATAPATTTAPVTATTAPAPVQNPAQSPTTQVLNGPPGGLPQQVIQIPGLPPVTVPTMPG
ncbi:septum formation family protein [Mycobacterium sp. OTB74]|uniref:septum formation family protein n=1 Tax=Mycobacterium sp. OTB74 TaxID=1853452 RepID=UPI0024755DDF|nr:septum formation family protein [Mycobacterium sp. OTB74]